MRVLVSFAVLERGREQVGRTGSIVCTVHGAAKGALIPFGLRVAQMGFQRGDASLVHAAKVLIHSGLDTVAMILQSVIRPCSYGAGAGLRGGPSVLRVAVEPHFCRAGLHRS